MQTIITILLMSVLILLGNAFIWPIVATLNISAIAWTILGITGLSLLVVNLVPEED